MPSGSCPFRKNWVGIVPFSFYNERMIRVASSSALTAAILSAPAWAKIGLTMRDERMRERAAQELAETLLDRLADDPAPEPHPDQLALAL
jgi:vancomycin permeability regulator SanA